MTDPDEYFEARIPDVIDELAAYSGPAPGWDSERIARLYAAMRYTLPRPSVPEPLDRVAWSEDVRAALHGDLAPYLIGEWRTAYTAAPALVYDDILAQLRRIEELTRDLPPLPEWIRLHPDEVDRFRGMFPDGDGALWMGRPMLGVPVIADGDVPPETLRIRFEGVDRDLPFPFPRWTPDGWDAT